MWSRRFLLMGALLSAACGASRPDIVGHNSDARRWAEQQHEPDSKERPDAPALPQPVRPNAPEEVPPPPPPAQPAQ